MICSKCKSEKTPFCIQFIRFFIANSKKTGVTDKKSDIFLFDCVCYNIILPHEIELDVARDIVRVYIGDVGRQSLRYDGIFFGE